MPRSIIQAYLYQDIIRLGFSPSSSKERKSWLRQYGQSLKAFWEINDYPPAPSERNGAISSTINASESINAEYEYNIEKIEKFTVRLIHSPNVQIMWVHDMDGVYFTFPCQTFLTEHNQRNPEITQMTDDDIGRVIDSLFVHPAPHQHIESPIDNHEIRIGGGIINPFQYLFHLRIQLCPIADRRESERNRLIELFGHAIRNNQPVTANELMKVPT